MIKNLEYLEKKIGELENRVKKLEGNSCNQLSLDTSCRDRFAVEENVLKKEVFRKKNDSYYQFLLWLKTNWQMKLGVFLLILAVSWFVTYAFLNNWIGPVGRITIGLLFGSMIMVFGDWQMKRRETLGQTLISAGGVMILLTLFAARFFYNFFTPNFVMIYMGVDLVAMVLIAFFRDKKSIAYVSLIGAIFVPLLVVDQEWSNVFMMNYMVMVGVVFLILIYLKNWAGIGLLSFLATMIYSMILFNGMEEYQVWSYMALIFGIYMLVYAVKAMQFQAVKVVDVITVLLLSLLMLGWIDAFVPTYMQSIVLTVLSLLMFGSGYIFLTKYDFKKYFYAMSVIGILFLGMATGYQFENAGLVVAFSIEGVLLVWITELLFGKKNLTKIVAISLVLPFILGLDNINGYMLNGDVLFDQNFYAIMSVILALSIVSLWIKNRTKEEVVAGILAVGAIFYTFLLIWLFDYKLFESGNVAKAISLVIYSLVGLGSFIYGWVKQYKSLVILGNIILGLVVLRLLFVEIWDMSLEARIIAFGVIGVLLISTAFIQKKHIN